MIITENELLKLKQALISLDDEATLVNQALEKSDGVIEEAKAKIKLLTEQRPKLAAQAAIDGNRNAMADLRKSLADAEDDLLVAEASKKGLIEKINNLQEPLIKAEIEYKDAMRAYWREVYNTHVQAALDAAKPHLAKAIDATYQSWGNVSHDSKGYWYHLYECCDFSLWYKELKMGEIGDLSVLKSKNIKYEEKVKRGIHMSD